MPNHVHAIIAFSNTGKTINSIIANGKRFMAYELVKRLQKETKNDFVLNELNSSLNKTERKEGKQHNVLETLFDWKKCDSEKFVEQRLAYIHWNPCNKNKLSALPEEYIHSSAKFYITGKHGVYPVTNLMELNDVDLSKEL